MDAVVVTAHLMKALPGEGPRARGTEAPETGPAETHALFGNRNQTGNGGLLFDERPG